jgi:hypothetical protein
MKKKPNIFVIGFGRSQLHVYVDMEHPKTSLLRVCIMLCTTLYIYHALADSRTFFNYIYIFIT